ncbi:MAG: archaellin/type IV pilin N-terminal domain-containing protein [Candidatus Nezhaarchaeales archaeon]
MDSPRNLGSGMIRARRLARKGLTGIETAIILISFVIVASVFAFAVLNLGMVTTQQSQSVVTTGLQQASSALQIQGHVIAYGDPNSEEVWGIRVYLNLAPGQAPVDFNPEKMVISYQNGRMHVPDVYEASDISFWSASRASEAEGAFQNGNYSDQKVKCMVVVIQGNDNYLLEPGETFALLLRLDNINENAILNPYDSFTVEIKPQIGATLTITRTIPASVTTIIDLH